MIPQNQNYGKYVSIDGMADYPATSASQMFSMEIVAVDQCTPTAPLRAANS
jgi:hypothetical protein